MPSRFAIRCCAALLAGALFAGTAAAQELADKLDLCLSCHGEAGQPPGRGVPGLAGQPEARLAEELAKFRDGRRENPQMVMAKRLTDAEVVELSAFFSRQSPVKP